MWRANCECLAEYDEIIAAKDAEIERLKESLGSLVGTGLIKNIGVYSHITGISENESECTDVIPPARPGSVPVRKSNSYQEKPHLPQQTGNYVGENPTCRPLYTGEDPGMIGQESFHLEQLDRG